MTNPVEKQLFDAAGYDRVSAVSSLLRDHPDINVNWTIPEYNHQTALHIASILGHAEVVKLLLAHPDIDVNLKNISGHTHPFHLFSCC